MRKKIGKVIRSIIIIVLPLYIGAYMLGIGPATLREMTSSGVRPVLTRQVIIAAHNVRNDYERSDTMRQLGDGIFNLVWDQSDNRQKAIIARYLELQREKNGNQ